MFTGIVQDVGSISSVEPRDGDLRIEVAVSGLDLGRATVGDSIAVAGVCLTIVALGPRGFCADVSNETSRLTTAGFWRPGRRVNLEPALRAGDAMGGHLMVGHVDGIAQLIAREGDARSQRFTLRVPAELALYIARKGSVTLDGVSLTVNAVRGTQFEVNLVPHTLAVTTLGELAVGDQLNLEVDLIARYLERLAGFDRAVQ
ncbi:MAG TPA: riboflavin synthase [Steroidobacteraceae bacterium]|nr:riboflavin synthase [Steroidobacteraceae bacterium]